MELLVKANTGLEVLVEVLLLEAHLEVSVVVHLEDLLEDQVVDQAIPSIHQVVLVEAQVEVHKEDLEGEMVVPVVREKEENLAPWRKPFPVYQEMTIPYFLRYQIHHSFVMAKPMEVITRILKQSVKPFIFVQMMEMEEGQNTASFVPMEPFSNKNILSVTGGSMLIVPLLRNSIPSMMTTQQKEQPIQEKLVK